jgi:hypothetical protein
MRSHLLYVKLHLGAFRLEDAPPSIGGAVILGHEGTGTVMQENNRIVSGSSPFVSASPQIFGDFALPTGSPLIDAGKPGMGPSLDLLGNPAPRGAAPDIGAAEF